MRLTFALQLLSDYHVGAGHGLGSEVDSALLRDSDGVPSLRGSTLAGLMRDGLWRLLQTKPLQGYRKCKGSDLSGQSDPAYCIGHLCPVCTIFGTPQSPKRWRFSSARPAGLQRPLPNPGWRGSHVGAQAVARVRVNPRTRRAETRKFFKQEEGDARLHFIFTVDCQAYDAETMSEAALLVAAARMVRRLGSARRRGRGQCILELTSVEGGPATPQVGNWQDFLLERFRQTWLIGDTTKFPITRVAWKRPEKTSDDPRRFRILARIDEPLVVARHSEAGNFFDCAAAVPGSAVLGTLAEAAAERWNLSDTAIYSDFLSVFRSDRVRFGPLYPAYLDQTTGAYLFPTVPIPLDVLACKARGELDHQHTPIISYATHDIPNECQTCKHGIPLVALGGFVAIRDKLERVIPRQREEMHPRVNPRTQRVEERALYGYVALEAGQYLMGELWCRDDGFWQTLCHLTGVLKEKTAFTLRMGKATRRGYGLVSAWVESVETEVGDPLCPEPILERVNKPVEPITLTLLTDAILPDRWGRFHQTLDGALLKEIIGQPVQPIRAFCKSVPVDGFNNHLGLPRWRDIALKAGSAVGFTIAGTQDLETLCDNLSNLEKNGIGLRRSEGFGSCQRL